VPRVALTVEEAAEAVGISRRFFESEVLPDLRVIPLGKGSRTKKLVAVAELQRWAEERSALLIERPLVRRPSAA
jgi:hypothetical protein